MSNVEDKNMVHNFLLSRQDDIRKNTIDFVKAVIDIEKDIKALKDDISAITKEAKENQVNIKAAKRAISKLKYMLKTSQDIIDEEESVLEALKEDGAVIANLSELVSK